ncbi:Di-copper centre-containing protein [Dothidotthia symphoricarpi CBS 119687]|uniref:Di-copper centre-containing protein n=1 Tax=Dothidotthia symphoricarpi CBS 119687 TaxID=1392245 RepID=A0A6A6AI16_9PLEO|nr:Di-copper centre-containing protein [Dothidotthia symphoricarpi CBS 119687]KAF2130893.1 Di-copper centre-containing protein [Dothidotthia symphoricarpi CBS 119687]
MKFSGVIAAVATLVGSIDATLLESDLLSAQAVLNLGVHVAQNGYPNPQKCTLRNVAIRREWSTLSKSEKLNYIDAVKCLAKKPARTPAAIASGARNRYDDFVVTHLQQTPYIHVTGNFLTWHRYFTWAYEQTLRNECGYKGYQPYYNWPRWADDPTKSPLFDGSATSMSGDGAFVANRTGYCLPSEARCFTVLQPGTGGGCVSGPFQNFTVNLGPGQSHGWDVKPNPQADALGYNPRCLKRDINTQASKDTSDENVSNLIKNFPDVASFQSKMQTFQEDGNIGVHNGGHYTVGGDAGSDFSVSPGDPGFYFHHAMIDRTWWTWQMHDIDNRMMVIAGTLTFRNDPPTRNATLQDTLTLGYVGMPNITIADAVNTLDGPFCYIYG